MLDLESYRKEPLRIHGAVPKIEMPLTTLYRTRLRDLALLYKQKISRTRALVGYDSVASFNNVVYAVCRSLLLLPEYMVELTNEKSCSPYLHIQTATSYDNRT